MSESDGGPGRREVAYRLFAAEFEDADLAYKESDEERAPNYVVTPTGARVNRLFAVGVLTEVEDVNESMVRGRVVDPTGAFVLYAGQYQPDALAFLERADPPAFVAVTGKARTFEPEDGDRVFTSVRPESLNHVDAETRDRWVVGTAERTVERVGTTAGAIETGLTGEHLRAALEHAGVEAGLAAGIPLALEHYGTTPTYLQAVRETALDAVRVVAGEREEIGERPVAPDATGDVAAGSLADPEVAGATVPPGTDLGAAGGKERSTEDPTTAGGGSADAAEPAGGSEVEVEAEEEVSTADLTDEDTDEVAADPEEFDLDEETRREVEEEHGVEFSTGSEVDGPGEADIETGEPDDEPETAAAEPVEEPPGEEDAGETGDGAEAPGGEGADDELETAGADDSVEPQADDDTDESGDGESDDDAETAPADTDPTDLDDAVLEAMAARDDGDGADRAALVEQVADDAGVDPSAVEAAIEEALKSGRCYEPADGRLKPI